MVWFILIVVMKMNYESALPYKERPHLPTPGKAKKRSSEKARSPYDGLRPWSAITHGFGAVLALVGLLALLVHAHSLNAGMWHMVSFTIYGLSMVALYTASTLYHSLNTSVKWRIALRKYDHTCIYFLIAGSYTPICLIALRPHSVWGWILFGVAWGLTAAGLVLSVVWITTPRWLTSGIYLFMGWIAVFALVPLSQILSSTGFALLFGGGLLYTAGGILYALKWPGRNNPRFGCHEIFHVFIVLGSIAHFIMMYCVVAPMP